MPNHTIFRLHNANVMRHESNHFATMRVAVYSNQSGVPNSIHFYGPWLFTGVTSDAFAVLCGVGDGE